MRLFPLQITPLGSHTAPETVLPILIAFLELRQDQQDFYCPKTRLLKLLCDKAHYPKFFKHLSVKVLIDRLVVRQKLFVDDSLDIEKKQTSMCLIFYLLILAFLGLGKVKICHSMLWCLVSESYSKLPLPLMTRSRTISNRI